MTAKHEPHAAPEVKQDSGADQAPEAGADELIGGEPEAPRGSADSPDPVEQDLHELTARADRADEYLELAKRTKADFENYRKRAARESAAAQERGVVRLAKELLPAVDNLDRALAAAEGAAANGGNADADATLISGVKLVHQDVIAALAAAGDRALLAGGRAVRSAASRGGRAGSRRGRGARDHHRGLPTGIPARRERAPARSSRRRRLRG